MVSTNGAIKNTGTPKAQLTRYTKVIEKWIKSINERETIYNGDDNIDLDKDFTKPESLSILDTKTTPLFNLLKEKIYTAGVSLIRTGPTKHNINSQDTYLDHIFTTSPERIITQTVHRKSYSDHYPVTFLRRTGKVISHPAYILARDYKLVNWGLVKDQMNTDIRLITAAMSNSPDEISELIKLSITEHIDAQAPMKRIQLQNETTTFATKTTQELIKKKETLQKILADITDDPENAREYKHLRNKAHKELSKDKANITKKKIISIRNDDPKSQWSEIKKLLGWRKSSTPKILKDKEKVVTSPKEIAQLINREQITKNIKTTQKHS